MKNLELLVLLIVPLVLLPLLSIGAFVYVTEDYAIKRPLAISSLLGINASEIQIVTQCNMGFTDFQPFTTYLGIDGNKVSILEGDFGIDFTSGDVLLFIARGSFESSTENNGTWTLRTYAFLWVVPHYVVTETLFSQWLGLGLPSSHVVPDLWQMMNVSYSPIGPDTNGIGLN